MVETPPRLPYRIELTAALRPELEASCARSLWHQNRGAASRARALREKIGVARWGRPVGLAMVALGLLVCAATLAAGNRSPAVVVETALFVLALPVFVKLRALQAAATRWSDALARRRIAAAAQGWSRRALAELPLIVDYDLRDGVLESSATLPGVVRPEPGRCPACGTPLVPQPPQPVQPPQQPKPPLPGIGERVGVRGHAEIPISSPVAPSEATRPGASSSWVCPRHPPRVEAWRFDLRTAPHVVLAGRTACFFRDERALLPMRLLWCPDDAALERVKLALRTLGRELIILPDEAPMVTHAAG